jgi:transcriptional regulator with XRE-family HTH domain
MATYQERVAARIRAERRSRGMSREEAARQAGISFRQYQRWETGQSEPRDANLRQLAEAWGIPVERLRPPEPEHEEREVREQLNRIEALLELVATRLVGRVDGADLSDVLDEVVRPIEELAREADQEPPARAPAGRGRRRAAPGR